MMDTFNMNLFLQNFVIFDVYIYCKKVFGMTKAVTNRELRQSYNRAKKGTFTKPDRIRNLDVQTGSSTLMCRPDPQP